MLVRQLPADGSSYTTYIVGPFGKGETEWAQREAKILSEMDKEEHFAFASLLPIAARLLPAVKAVGPTLLTKGLNLAKNFLGGKVSGITELTNIASGSMPSTSEEEEQEEEDEEDDESPTIYDVENANNKAKGLDADAAVMQDMLSDEYVRTIDLDECVHIDVMPANFEGRLFLKIRVPAMKYDQQEYFIQGLLGAGMKSLGKLFGRSKRKKKRKMRRKMLAMQQAEQAQAEQAQARGPALPMVAGQNIASMGVELPMGSENSVPQQGLSKQTYSAPPPVEPEEEEEENVELQSPEEEEADTWEDAR